jgi:parallel beta-helix repeat protein
LLGLAISWLTLPSSLRNRVAPVAYAASFTVTNTNNDGPGSLRQAIVASNQNPGPINEANVITFNIPGSGIQKILLNSDLPVITASVLIDGTTQPGFSGSPLIELNGQTFMLGRPNGVQPGVGHALDITAGLSIVRGLRMNNFGGAALVLRTNGGNLIQGNYFGTEGPSSEGMYIASSDNIIGGTTAAERNVVATHPFTGIIIDGVHNRVQGNYIGTDETGTVARGAGTGLRINGSNNIIGGTTAGAGNLLSGNLTNLIISSSNNLVSGNRIGTDFTGNVALGREGDGIVVAGGDHNLISDNQISGNPGTGVVLGGSSQLTTLTRNRIGVNASGNQPLANNVGVSITSFNNFIGYPTDVAPNGGNVIAGNTTDGLVISGHNNLIKSNLIGNNDHTALKNGGDGIRISGYFNHIGGNVNSTNAISGNGGNGIQLVGSQATGNTIISNRIGLDITRTLPGIPNLGHGILISSGANGTTIGGADTPFSQLHNFIAYNKGDGIRVEQGVDNQVLGNYIDNNEGNGVFVNDSGITLANRLSILGNRIFDNGSRAIDLAPAGVTTNDAGDADSGPNGLQNFPLLNSATAASGVAFIKGTLNSKPNVTYRLDFFSATACDPSGNGEANNFLGFSSITTDGNGNASFEFSSPRGSDAAVPGQVATAVATDPQGNTSELSPCVSIQDGGAFSFFNSRTTVHESTPSVNVTVHRFGTASGATSVDYSTADASASAGTDYTAVSGTLNFAVNESDKTISIPIINDTLAEGIEIFKVNLSNPHGGPGLFTRSADIIIDDDDNPSGIVYAITADNHLLSFNSTRPDAIFENRAIVGEKVTHIDFRPATGQLYALGESGHLYTVNLANVTLTQVGTATLPNFGGFDFNPVTDRIRLANQNGNVEVSPVTGAIVTTGTALSFAPGDTNFGTSPVILALAHTNNVAGATSTTTYGIHLTNAFFPTQLVSVGSVNGSPVSPNSGQLFTVGETGAATATYAGFDVADNGEAFASLAHPEAGTFATFYKINLATGSTERLGTLIDPNFQGITDIAVQPAEKLDFTASLFSVNENAGTATITVTRTSVGGVTGLDYSTSDGTATAGADYQPASGELIFQPGEASKTFQVPILDDGQLEGVESVNLSLTIFASDSGGLSGTTRTARIAIMDEPTEAGTTPIDNADFFVRQHYSDFLNRQPDSGGLAFWTNHITVCFNDPACINDRRIGTSAAFFIENEFQQTGFYIYRLYQAALGRRPTYAEFTADRGQVVGGANLEAGKQAFAISFVQRQSFLDKYPLTMDGPTFVDAVISTASQASGVSDLSSRRAALLAQYNSGVNQTDSRVRVMRALADDSAFSAALYNPAFVLMQYFGYLRRQPDQNGYNFWLDHLNTRNPNNYRAMVCAFITSQEYQRRFSNLVTRSNQDCAQ